VRVTQIERKRGICSKIALCCTIISSTVILQIEYLVRTNKYQSRPYSNDMSNGLLMAVVGVKTHVEWEADNSMNIPSLSTKAWLVQELQ